LIHFGHPVASFLVPTTSTSSRSLTSFSGHCNQLTASFTNNNLSMPRTSSRKVSTKSDADETPSDPLNSNANDSSSRPSKLKGKKTLTTNDIPVDADAGANAKPKKTTATPTKKRKKTATAAAAAAAAAAAVEKTNDDESSVASSEQKKTKKTTTTEAKSPSKKKVPKKEVQSITERDELPKLWNNEKAEANKSQTLRVASWNVAGLRAIVKKEPNALTQLVQDYDIDVLALQETKLQESHLDDPKLLLRNLLNEQGYDSYWTCSTVKKGYAGTVVFVKRRGSNAAPTNKATKKQTDISSFFGKKNGTKVVATNPNNDDNDKPKSTPSHAVVDDKLLVPEEVTYTLGKDKHDGEGRIVVLDFPTFTMVTLYVPNSGQKLERLDYRLNEWDKDLLEFVQERQRTRGVPVMWLGDLNVAHKEFDAYNFGAKHLDKQAGLTPQERASFQAQLDAGYVDAFRELHPEAKGHYTYWSQRAGNRVPNKGLRLDYFVCPKIMFSEESKVIVRDSYMLPEQLGSDHGPAVLELEIKP